jgi:transcriptional regulator with XRE-family HTH domain
VLYNTRNDDASTKCYRLVACPIEQERDAVTTAEDKFPYRDTAAAQMLARGLHRLSTESRVSIRQLAKRLGLKQATVISHMASGRMPIPLDRAGQLAAELSLPTREFLFSVLDQRHSETNWREQLSTSNSGELVLELEAIAGHPLDGLSAEQLSVLREVVAEPKPRRRWLTVHEVKAVEKLRRLRPIFGLHGLSASDMTAIEKALLGSD